MEGSGGLPASSKRFSEGAALEAWSASAEQLGAQPTTNGDGLRRGSGAGQSAGYPQLRTTRRISSAYVSLFGEHDKLLSPRDIFGPSGISPALGRGRRSSRLSQTIQPSLEELEESQELETEEIPRSEGAVSRAVSRVRVSSESSPPDSPLLLRYSRGAPPVGPPRRRLPSRASIDTSALLAARAEAEHVREEHTAAGEGAGEAHHSTAQETGDREDLAPQEPAEVPLEKPRPVPKPRKVSSVPRRRPSRELAIAPMNGEEGPEFLKQLQKGEGVDRGRNMASQDASASQSHGPQSPQSPQRPRPIPSPRKPRRKSSSLGTPVPVSSLVEERGTTHLPVYRPRRKSSLPEIPVKALAGLLQSKGREGEESDLAGSALMPDHIVVEDYSGEGGVSVREGDLVQVVSHLEDRFVAVRLEDGSSCVIPSGILNANATSV